MKLLTKIGIANLLAIGILLSASSLHAEETSKSAENNSQDLIVASGVENQKTTNKDYGKAIGIFVFAAVVGATILTGVGEKFNR
ncbi:MAG: hypothetical protein ACFBSE_10160 [Prochloraceae cyanobacterium]